MAGLWLAASVWLAAQSSTAPATQAPDAKFAAAIERGEAALKLRWWQEALDAFKDANSSQGNKSAVALYGMSRAHHGMGAFKDAVNACADALRYTGADKRLESSLHNQRGMAFFALYQQDDRTDTYLKEAEAEYRLAVAIRDAPPMVWYNLGVALLRQSRDDEGRAALQTYVDSGAPAIEVELARKILSSPPRNRTSRAPDFTVVTLDGQRLSSKELAGKTIVLDFWGTWCAPCRVATPDLVKFAKKYSKDPNFIMIGISSDRPADEKVLREYIAKNQMDWPQRFDTPRQVIPLFDVKDYPTYIVIDREGIVRERILGWPNAAYGSTVPYRSSVLNAIEAAVKKSLQGK